AFFYFGLLLMFWLNPNMALTIWVIKWFLQQTYLALIHFKLNQKLPVAAFISYELYALLMHFAMIAFYIYPTKMDWKGRKYSLLF
ncbi:MAG: hypothetical protein ACOVK9_03240, partial [Bacteroidia bacterium]